MTTNWPPWCLEVLPPLPPSPRACVWHPADPNPTLCTLTADATLEGCCSASGLYYHGHWAEGFNPEDSQRDIFNCSLDPHVRNSGRTVSALMLRKRAKLPYAEVPI